jgi:Ca-activated chloride channel family protein
MPSPSRKKCLPTLFSVGALLSAVACGAEIAGSTAHIAPRQAGSDEVWLTVTVADRKNAPVPGLPQTAFAVLDGKTPQDITSFRGGEVPASVAVLFDLSGSVDAPGSFRVKAAAAGASRFVESGNSSNEYFVVGFADDLTTFLDGSRNPAEAEAAFDKVAAARGGKQTSLFDACYQAIPKLSASAYAKRVLILVTDGEDTYSRATQGDILKLLKEGNVVVYPVKVGLGQDPVAEPGAVQSEGARILDKFARVSGGLSYSPRSAKEMSDSFERIAAEVRSQYVLGFKPATPIAPGKCRSFKIRVTPPQGFVAGGKSPSVRSREEFCRREP